MAHTKNKMKAWRRLANKIKINVPRERIKEDGSKEIYTEEAILSGRQVKAYTGISGGKAPPTGLLKDLMKNAGIYTMNIDDVIVSNEGEVNEAVS